MTSCDKLGALNRGGGGGGSLLMGGCTSASCEVKHIARRFKNGFREGTTAPARKKQPAQK